MAHRTPRPAPNAGSDWAPAPGGGAATTREMLLATTRVLPAPSEGDDAAGGAAPAAAAAAASGEPVYTCQATEVLRASTPMRWWEPGQYVRDVRSGNAGVVEVVADLVRWLFVAVHLRLTGSSIPFVHGRQEKTPRGTLGLQPGDRVRVRSRAEIEATLDRTNHARGLSFDAEMLRYCGTEATVRTRVEQLIDERTGRMRQADKRLLDPRGRVLHGRVPSRVPTGDLPLLAGELARARRVPRRESGRVHDGGGRSGGAGAETRRRLIKRAPRPTSDGKSGAAGQRSLPGQLRRHPHRRPAR